MPRREDVMAAGVAPSRSSRYSPATFLQGCRLMSQLPRFMHRFAALASIVVMLAGAAMPVSARAAHLAGPNKSVALPCHHALDNDAARPTDHPTTDDRCREACLTSSGDLAVVSAAVSRDDAVVSLDLGPAYQTPENRVAFTRLDISHSGLARDGPPRPALYLYFRRLLI